MKFNFPFPLQPCWFSIGRAWSQSLINKNVLYGFGFCNRSTKDCSCCWLLRCTNAQRISVFIIAQSFYYRGQSIQSHHRPGGTVLKLVGTSILGGHMIFYNLKNFISRYIYWGGQTLFLTLEVAQI